MTVVIGVQRRFMQLGRVRLGEKGPKGEPRKLSTFRFTSASERLLNAVAEKYGGTVTAWEGAPDEGYYQVTTTATSIDIILPPTFSEQDGTPSTSYSQWFEMWSRGGCQRRCDGVTESLTGEPCMCDPQKREAGAVSECKIVTRVSFIIPDLPGLGVWRLDSGGWNAAVELPGTLSLLQQAAAEQRFIPAVLSLQNRTSKKDGKTFKYVVPVIELPDVTIGELVSGTAPTLALNAPPAAGRGKPALPPGPVPPADTAFENGQPGFGDRPALPAPTSGVASSAPDEAPGEAAPPEPPPIDRSRLTEPQAKKLNMLVGKLRDGGHITTTHLYRVMDPDNELDWPRDEDGELHWSDLRETLSRDEARELIDRLERKLEQVETQTQFSIPEGARP